MSLNNPYEAYQNNAIQTASGSKLTLMLYNGCINFINRALQELEDRDYEAKNHSIQRAQAIVQELMITLDQSVDIAQQMLPLYEYMNHKLQQGNIKNDPESLKEALAIATEFRDTWQEVMKKTAKSYQTGTRV